MSSNIALPWPDNDANKYSRGRLVLIAGSARYPGAAVLAACAGQRMGAGYTEVVTAKEAIPAIRAASPSLVVSSIGDWTVNDLPLPAEGKPSAACIGPGFVPNDSHSSKLVIDLLRKAKCPVLVDGGGLNALASEKGLRALARRADKERATVITPHGGEAARLARYLGIPNGNPSSLAAGLALATRSTVVLKGPDTFVSDGTRTEPMTAGTPALAKAGTGDVLAGMISALLAQGASAFDAALLGSELHALAGKAAAEDLTEICVVAEDVIAAIPKAIRCYERQTA